MKNTPNYIKTLVKPSGKSTGRKVWSVDLETVWLTVFYRYEYNGRYRVSPVMHSAHP